MSRCVRVNGSSLCSLLFVLLFLPFAPNAIGTDAPLMIAAASSLRSPLEEIVRRFEKEHPIAIKIAYGASGALFSQIRHGAPFDLFLSAETDLAEKLTEEGQSESPFSFAYGQLVLWMPGKSITDIEKTGLSGLLHPSIKKIAVANPALAPYGKAALAALNHFGVYEKVREKLIFGENIAQAAHFVAVGTAEAGIVAYSIAGCSAKGTWLIPGDTYPPIEYRGVILKKDADPTRQKPHAFAQFMTSDKIRKIWSTWMGPQETGEDLFCQQ